MGSGSAFDAKPVSSEKVGERGRFVVEELVGVDGAAEKEAGGRGPLRDCRERVRANHARRVLPLTIPIASQPQLFFLFFFSASLSHPIPGMFT